MGLTASAIAMAGFHVQSAQAACVKTGSTYQCDGTGNGGISDGDDLVINVNPGAEIDGGAQSGINVGDRITIKIHDGEVRSSGDHAINAGDDVAVNITAAGLVETSDGDALHLGDNGQVENLGIIRSTDDDGIQMDDNGHVTNNGEIYGEGDAIVAGDDFTLLNHGMIAAEGSDGLDLGDNATVSNFANGVIKSKDGDAIKLGSGSTLTNEGMIVTSGDEAIEANGENNITIINSGTILADEDGDKAIEANENLTITNSGVIESKTSEAIEADGAGLMVTNSGMILADFDDAIDGNADTTIINLEGGLIRGGNNDAIELDNGTVDNAGIILSTSTSTAADQVGLDAGIDFDIAGGKVTNRATGQIEGDIAIGAAAANMADIEIINQGSLVGRLGAAIEMAGANLTLNNSGMIEGRSNGAIAVRQAMMTNSGSITAASGNAITLQGGNIVNNGTISTSGTGSGDAAIRFIDGADAGNGEIVNNGTIRGVIGVIAVANDTEQRLINNGALIGTGGLAANLGDGDDYFELGANGTVTGQVLGGAGDDLALIRGVYSSDFLQGFETVELNGATINGLRTIAADVSVTGAVNFVFSPVDARNNANMLAVNGDVSFANGAVVNIATDIADVYTIGLNTPYALMSASGIVTNDGAVFNVADDDFLLDYVAGLSGNNVVITANAVNPGANSGDGNVQRFGNIVQLGYVARTLDSNLLSTINGFSDIAQFEALSVQLLPTMNDGVTREIYENSVMFADFMNERAESESYGFWGQFGYRNGRGDGKSATVAGFNADSFGFTIGADMGVGDTARAGVYIGYANSDVEDRSIANAKQDMDSWKYALYGAFNVADNGFVNAEVSYVTSDVDDRRSGPGAAIVSNYDVDGFFGRIIAGYDFAMGEEWTITPSAAFNYGNFNYDDYSETGGLGFGVDRDDVDFIESRLALSFKGDYGNFKPFVDLAWTHDFDGDQRTAVLTTNGTPSFVVSSGDVDNDAFEVDAGLSYALNENIDVDLYYLGDFGSDYKSNGGAIRLRYEY